MDYIDKLDEAGEKATAGPWRIVEQKGEPHTGDPKSWQAIVGIGTPEGVIANASTVRIDHAPVAPHGDWDFIALARNVWPELVAVVREATRFVPDPGTIQWERREVDLKAALAALAAKVGGG